ncbi:hypothetical protein HanXRQr2_Chr13g0590631 [Helianthus annuus]|uniref:Uncharacterized protein n=1 Tax=Helianthus annuus TaxID=4232 RepID=A0A9K3HC57_HELAN|nr:hypothetical protein HanXRQr2_Chr13g0590631 [Helianthus annuus]KAJ0849439.1 hypothetical protein HanPSC8_Chr13g0568751 [Helianthus annuus]
MRRWKTRAYQPLDQRELHQQLRYRITVTISDKTGEKGWSYGCAPATTHESRCVTT